MATKKPMKKFKRYAEGGPAEEAMAKERGLEISNRDDPKPSGFFERLKSDMRRIGAGSIDTPGTEAYNKYGAGRGRDRGESVSVNQPMPSTPSMPAASSRPLSDDMYSDFGPSAGRSSGETVMPTRATATKPAAPVKSAKVTKEELDKSGLSLRDYLNKQQGLTRKESAKAAVPDAEMLEKKRMPRYTPPGSAPQQSMGRQRQPFMPGDVDNSFPGAKFKDGGKVRSASARADGIAIRGKTRA